MAKLRDGSTYLANHLSANDYYAEKESVTGVWVGQGAERLGLAGRDIGAHDDAFERLRGNRHPLTGRKLTTRTGGGRIVFLDFQCSAPKSVSLLAVTFGDERLREAHRDAVSIAFAELEKFAARRVRAGAAAWSDQTAITGNLCAARFEHDASRALDAQLHTHLVTANATFDAKAEKWFALTEREMVGAIRYAGKVYQNELARGVHAAGYDIVDARNERGVIEGFEIVGVSPEDRAIASKRRAVIEKGIAAFRGTHGREPTTHEIHGITTQTRGDKLTEITTAEVRRRQRADFSPERAEALDACVDAARRRGPVPPGVTSEAMALQHARDHLFERASVQRGHDVLAEALNQNLGHVALEPLQHALIQEQVTDCVALTPGQHGLLAEYATREGLRQELAAIAVVNQGRRACAPLGDQRFQADERVSADQRNAVRALLESTDRVCALRGVAGAGKTFALKEVQRGLTAAGREIFACAPTTSAAEVLRGEGFSGAITLADLLKNGETVHGARLRGATLIVDEAGITSTRQGAELCALVQRQDARLLLVGDSHQHSGVEAGDFLALLEKHSHLRTAELTDIRRQSVRAYRGAVKLMAQGQARAGLSALDQLGWIEERGATYVRRAADHYVDRLAAQRDVILVAPTWAEIHRLTDAVRTGLKQRGLLGESQSVAVAEPLGWTRAQAERVTNYRPGFWLTLHRPLREAGLPAGETVEVIGVGRGALRIRDGQGREVNVSPRGDATSWTAAAPRVIELASGDRVLIRQNQRTAGLVNGEVLTLGVRKSDGAWSARDAAGQEKIIPADFRALAHGYAVTSHKSQGRTCDEVIVCAARLDAKAAYVAFSRARQRATGYTPDKAALFDALPASNRPRVAALDLWTPARSRRLRWVRQVVERVREMLAPILRLPELVAPPAMPMPAPVLKPRQAMGPSSRASQSRHAERAAPTMRVRF